MRFWLVCGVLPVLAACEGLGSSQQTRAVAVRPSLSRAPALANPDMAKIPTPKPLPPDRETAKSAMQPAALLPAPGVASNTNPPDDTVLAAIPSNLGSTVDTLARAKAVNRHLQGAGSPCTTPTAYKAILRRTLTDSETRHFTPARSDRAAIEVASVTLCDQPPLLMQAYVLDTQERRQIIDVLMLGPSTVDPVIALRVHGALKQMKAAVQRLPKGCLGWKIIGSERVGEKHADGRSPERWQYGACGAKMQITLTVPAAGAAGPLDDVQVVPG